jgi:hypothetical protein
LLATPPAVRAAAAWLPSVTSDARRDLDARDARDETCAEVATVELRAPGDAVLEVPSPGAPTQAANADVHAGAAARS